jgi:predicted AAA+ superfamily ATPase
LKGLGYNIASNNTLFSGANAPVGATASVKATQSALEPAGLSLLAVAADLAVAAGLTGLLRRRARPTVLTQARLA